MARSHVDANYRFIAASQEVNARITQRQQALGLYATLVVSLLAALVALKPGSSGNLPVEWLLPGFPVASISLAFLNHKAERTITNLRSFLSSLERLEEAHEQLPSYNTDPRWAEGANRARRFHDFAAAILVVGGNGIGIGAALHIYPERVVSHPLLLGISLIATLASVASLLLVPRWGYTPRETG